MASKENGRPADTEAPERDDVDNVPSKTDSAQPHQLYGMKYGEWVDIAREVLPRRPSYQRVYYALVSFARQNSEGRVTARAAKIARRAQVSKSSYQRIVRDLIFCGLIAPTAQYWWEREAIKRGCKHTEVIVVNPFSENVQRASFRALQWFRGASGVCGLLQAFFSYSPGFRSEWPRRHFPPNPQRGCMSQQEIASATLRATMLFIKKKLSQTVPPSDGDRPTVGRSTVPPTRVSDTQNDSSKFQISPNPYINPKFKTKSKRRHPAGGDALTHTSESGPFEEENQNPPTISEVEQYINTNRLQVDPQRIYDLFSAIGWLHGKKPLDWQAEIRRAERNGHYRQTRPMTDDDFKRRRQLLQQQKVQLMNNAKSMPRSKVLFRPAAEGVSPDRRDFLDVGISENDFRFRNMEFAN